MEREALHLRALADALRISIEELLQRAEQDELRRYAERYWPKARIKK